MQDLDFLFAMQDLLAGGRVSHDLSFSGAHSFLDGLWMLCLKSINYPVYTISDVKGLVGGTELGSPERDS